MVAVLSRPPVQLVSEVEERAIYDLLYSRGAMKAENVASLLNLDESAVEVWLANQAGLRVVDYDPRFGNYSMFD